MPHPSHGGEVKAFVIRRPGAEVTEAELVAWGKRNMAGYEYPRVLKPVEPALKPVTGTAHEVTSQVAPAGKPVTSGLEPALAPLTRPVLRATPVTAPGVRAIGADHAAPAVNGPPAKPTQRGEVSAPPEVAAPDEQVTSIDRIAPVVDENSGHQRRHDAQVGSRHVAGDADATGVAGPTPGSSGGPPADVAGMSGALSARFGGQHGGEYAVTAAGSVIPGTDRTWRAPPTEVWSLHWLE